MADGVLKRSYDQIVDGLDSFVQNSFEQLTNAVFPSITGITIILIAWQGYRVYYGRTAGETITNSIAIIIRYAIVMALFGTFSHYQLFIENLFEALPDKIGEVIAGGWRNTGNSDPESIIALLDDFTKTATEKAAALAKGWDVGEVIVAAIILAVTYIFTVYSVLQFGITVIVTKLFLALTPIALTAVLFEKTKGIFEGWLRVLITMASLKVLLVLIISMLMAIFGDAADNLNPKNQNDGTTSVAVYIITVLLMMFVAQRLPDFAAQLGGGVSVSAASLTASAVSGGIGMAAGALARANRFQQGARNAYGAARDGGMGKGGSAGVAAYRGATEAARPDLSARRSEDARMKRRAAQFVASLKRNDQQQDA